MADRRQPVGHDIHDPFVTASATVGRSPWRHPDRSCERMDGMLTLSGATPFGRWIVPRRSSVTARLNAAASGQLKLVRSGDRRAVWVAGPFDGRSASPRFGRQVRRPGSPVDDDQRHWVLLAGHARCGLASRANTVGYRLHAESGLPRGLAGIPERSDVRLRFRSPGAGARRPGFEVLVVWPWAGARSISASA